MKMSSKKVLLDKVCGTQANDFVSKRGFQNHHRTHGAKDYTCDQCEKTFQCLKKTINLKSTHLRNPAKYALRHFPLTPILKNMSSHTRLQYFIYWPHPKLAPSRLLIPELKHRTQGAKDSMAFSHSDLSWDSLTFECINIIPGRARPGKVVRDGCCLYSGVSGNG